MSEGEIIKKLERYINGKDTMKETLVRAIQGLLDLYNKEKEKNRNLKIDIKEMYYKGVVLDILQDNLNCSRDEAIEILESY